MTQSFKLGRVFGIPIGLHYSWLFIFIWVTWSLAEDLFPSLYSDWSRSAYWSVAVISSILLFTSVLAHELGHSLAAIRFGIRVRAITLFVLGGIAQLSKEPSRPLTEGVIALAGPLVSLGLGSLFLVLYLAFNDINEQIAGASFYLCQANLFVGIFNLLPGFPMDGGRLFRAIVWAIGRSYIRATIIATSLGKIFGYALLVVGIGYGIWTGNLFSGLIGILIGIFIIRASSQTRAQVSVRQELTGVLVGQVMDGSDSVSIPKQMNPEAVVAPDDEIVRAIDVMQELDVSYLPVIGNGRLVGFVTRKSILQLIKEDSRSSDSSH